MELNNILKLYMIMSLAKIPFILTETFVVVKYLINLLENCISGAEFLSGHSVFLKYV